MKLKRPKRKLHTLPLEEGIKHYRISYGHNFRYLDINPIKPQVGIIEIGCADFPALRYVNHVWCTIVEPLPSSALRTFVNSFEDFTINKSGISLFECRFEDYAIDTDYLKGKEIWMFNVLQHVQDPEAFIEKAKHAKCIRYFEPIDTGVTTYHPFSFTEADFNRWFPGVNKYYNEITNQNFHDGPCCYGVWENKNIC